MARTAGSTPTVLFWQQGADNTNGSDGIGCLTLACSDWLHTKHPQCLHMLTLMQSQTQQAHLARHATTISEDAAWLQQYQQYHKQYAQSPFDQAHHENVNTDLARHAPPAAGEQSRAACRLQEREVLHGWRVGVAAEGILLPVGPSEDGVAQKVQRQKRPVGPAGGSYTSGNYALQLREWRLKLRQWRDVGGDWRCDSA
jgi:hypothetical protein